MTHGHAWASSDGQGVAARVTALRAAGAGKVFREAASGARGDQPRRSLPPESRPWLRRVALA